MLLFSAVALLADLPGGGSARSAFAAPSAVPPALDSQANAVVAVAGYMADDDTTAYARISGFFIETGPLVLTAYKPFVDRPSMRLCPRYRIDIADGRVVTAQMLAVDPILDLAILAPAAADDYPVAAIEEPAFARPGSEIYRVAWQGSPGEPVAMLGRVLEKPRKTPYTTGFGDMMISFRMQKDPEAVGALLVDQRGKALGLVIVGLVIGDPPTLESEPVDERHALPMAMVLSFLRVMLAYPTFELPWLGLIARPQLEAEAQETPSLRSRRRGLRVDFVWDEGPAARAGIHRGDALLELNGTPLRSLHELERLLAELGTDAKATLVFTRGDRTLEVELRTELRPLWAAPG
jgi:S1-C subfamily serine protease